MDVKVNAFGLVSAMMLWGIVLCGCSADTESDIAVSPEAIRLPKGVVVVPGQFVTNGVPATMEELKDDDLVVAIGRRYMTKVDFTRSLAKLEELVRVQCRKPAEFTNKWEQMRVQARWDVISDFIYENALTLDAELRGEGPAEEDLSFVSRQADALAKRLKMTRKDYIKAYYGNLENFSEKSRLSATARTYYNKHFRSKLAVSDAEVAELREGLKKRNKEVEKENEKLKARLEKFRDETEVSFLAKLTGDEVEDEKLLPKGFKCDLLDDQSRTALPDDEEVPAILRKTPLKTWSVVIDLPDTYDIYCITNAERRSVMTPTFYSGYRIYVEKDLGYAVPDDDRLKADIAMRKNQEVVMAAIGRLRSKFGCVLPHGECWDIPRKSAKGATRQGEQNLSTRNSNQDTKEKRK